VDQGLTTDYFGNPRQDGYADIGAIEYVPNISDVGHYGVAPQVLDDGRIVWQGWDGHDYEIYCQVPGQNATLMTNNDSPDVKPR